MFPYEAHIDIFMLFLPWIDSLSFRAYLSYLPWSSFWRFNWSFPAICYIDDRPVSNSWKASESSSSMFTKLLESPFKISNGTLKILGCDWFRKLSDWGLLAAKPCLTEMPWRSSMTQDSLLCWSHETYKLNRLSKLDRDFETPKKLQDTLYNISESVDCNVILVFFQLDHRIGFSAVIFMLEKVLDMCNETWVSDRIKLVCVHAVLLRNRADWLIHVCIKPSGLPCSLHTCSVILLICPQKQPDWRWVIQRSV